MASANDPNTWNLTDITTKSIYRKFMVALKEDRFSDNKIKELFLDSSVFFKNKAKEIVTSQETALTEGLNGLSGMAKFKITRNRKSENERRFGPAIRRVLVELIGNIDDRAKIESKFNTYIDGKEVDVALLKFLLSDEIFISVLSLNTLDITTGETKILLKTPPLISKSRGVRIKIPISNVVAEIIEIEKKGLEPPANNWPTVSARRRPKPSNAIIAIGNVRNHPVNTRRQGVREERNGRAVKNNNRLPLPVEDLLPPTPPPSPRVHDNGASSQVVAPPGATTRANRPGRATRSNTTNFAGLVPPLPAVYRPPPVFRQRVPVVPVAAGVPIRAGLDMDAQAARNAGRLAGNQALIVAASARNIAAGPVAIAADAGRAAAAAAYNLRRKNTNRHLNRYGRIVGGKTRRKYKR
jgi:hypothetical protein